MQLTIDPPWAAAPGTLIGIPPLQLTACGDADRDLAFQHMATEIVTWLTAFIPTVPCAGNNAAFIGVAVPTKIL